MAKQGNGQKVNRSELAAIFGISLPTVDAWVRDGCPGVKSGSGKGGSWSFHTADVSKWLQERARDEAGGDEAKDEATLKRRRLAVTLRADELDLAERMGLVAPIAEFERVQKKVFAMIRQNVMTVPARVAMSLVGEKSESRIKQVIRDELAIALKAVSEAEVELDDDEDDDQGGE